MGPGSIGTSRAGTPRAPLWGWGISRSPDPLGFSQAPFAESLSEASAGMLRAVRVQPATSDHTPPGRGISMPTVDRVPSTAWDHSVLPQGVGHCL